MNSTSSDREDFSRRKFLTGVTRGLLASAVVATNAGAVMPSPAQDTVPVDDEQLKRNLKLSPLYASSEQSADAPPLPYAPQFSIRFARATMAWTNSLVDAVPPRSPVRTFSISFTFGIRFKSAIVAPAKLHQEYFLAKACLTSVSKDLR
jgi:hypothetical protein